MMSDYYASFSPVRLGREDLVEILVEVLRAHDARLEVDLYEMTREGDTFDYTGESISAPSIYTAMQDAGEWDGVEFYFTWLQRSCGLALLRDADGVSEAVFSEPASLFVQHYESPSSCRALIDLLSAFCAALDASYCVFEPGWVGRGRRPDEIEAWSARVLTGQDRDWELVFLDAADWAKLCDRIAAAATTTLVSQPLGRYRIFSKAGRLPVARALR